MIQEIEPIIFSNRYDKKQPNPEDFILYFHEHKVLLKAKNDNVFLPTYEDLDTIQPNISEGCQYLFAMDEYIFHLAMDIDIQEQNDYKFYDIEIFRNLEPMWTAFSLITGLHLHRWYQNHRFCGKCGSLMEMGKNERVLKCCNCDNMVYPKISPAVIVGIQDGDKLLLSKYSQGGYKNYALIAGYVEIGETLEEAVRREVMEEVGIKVKNIRYFDSQPWGLSESILIGYFADLEGSNEITLDETELSEAIWVSREDLPVNSSNYSLTSAMIEVFRQQQ